MKLRRVIAIPFALLADLVTLGNMGERMFTQQLFDGERREAEARQVAEIIKSMKERT